MPDDAIPYADINNLLARSALALLSQPRYCADRRCRRHGRCRDIGPRDPHCARLLEDADFEELRALMQVAADIAQGRYPTEPSDDPAIRKRVSDAILVLALSRDGMPWFQLAIAAWYKTYAALAGLPMPGPVEPLAPLEPEAPQPKAPPAPKTDTAALLREMKAELEYARRIADIYDC